MGWPGGGRCKGKALPPSRAPCWWVFPLHTADNNEALGRACPMREVCHHWKPQEEMGLRTRGRPLRQCRKWKPSENRHHSRPPLERELGGRRCLRIARYLCRVCSVSVGWRQWEATISPAGGPETGGAGGAACAVPILRGPLSLLGAGAPPAGRSPGLRPLADLGAAALPAQVPQPPAELRRLPTARRLAEEGGALPGELRSPRLFRTAENPVLVPTKALEN